MDLSQNVPVTAVSPPGPPGTYGSLVAVGDRGFSTDESSDSRFFFLVLSLSDLSVEAQAVSTSCSDVPSAVQPYAGIHDHFLIFISIGQITGNLPQGDLHTFLSNAGAGRVLAGLEQTISQLGTGYFVYYTYALGATLDDGDLPGFEGGGLGDTTTLNFSFMPVDGGYAPVSL